MAFLMSWLVGVVHCVGVSCSPTAEPVATPDAADGELRLGWSLTGDGLARLGWKKYDLIMLTPHIKL